MNKDRAKGKGTVQPCLICGEDRISEGAHFPKRKRTGEGGENTIILCPTHHRLLDAGRLSRQDFEKIMTAMKDGSGNEFTKIDDFMDWAHSQGYPYSLDDLKNKFWNYTDDPEMM
jgi:hypothetical protein